MHKGGQMGWGQGFPGRGMSLSHHTEAGLHVLCLEKQVSGPVGGGVAPGGREDRAEDVGRALGAAPGP